MLTTIRKMKKSLGGLFMAGFLAILMVGFGLNARGAYRRKAEDTAIRIGKHEISQDRYLREVEQLTEVYRNQLGSNFGQLKNFLNLEQRAIDSLIEEYILQDFIHSLGLTASTSQVEGYIAQLPFFTKFGLTRETYESFLHAQGLTGEGLEEKTRQELGALQFQSILGDLAQPTERELKAVFQEQNTKFDFEYVSFRPDDFKSRVNTSDEAKLKEYFDKHGETYRKPRSVRYAYLKIDPVAYLDKVEITEEDIKERYAAKQSQFAEPKQIKLREIVIHKDKGQGSALEEVVTGKPAEQSHDGNSAKKLRADEVVTKLKAGEDFGNLAGVYSEDQATKSQGGDRGWLLPSALDKDLRSVADRVLKGKFSDVIETSDDYVILYIEDIKERRTKTFEEVRADLERELRSQDAPEYSRVDAQRTYRRWQDTTENRSLSLLEFAKKENRQASEAEHLLFEQESPPDAPGLTARLVSLSQGDKQTVQVGTTNYLVEILQTKEAYLPEFAEVQSKVIEAYVLEQSKILAKEAAQKALLELQGGSKGQGENNVIHLAEIAQRLGLSSKSTGLISRADPGKEPLIMQPEAKKLLFTLSDTQPSVNKVLDGPGGEFVIAGLKARVVPGDDEFKTSLGTLRGQEKQSAHARLGNFVYQSLRASADVWVNPKLLETNRARESA